MVEQELDWEPVEDVLVKSLLHKLMVAFHAPAGWPVGVVVLWELLWLGMAALPWWLLLDGRSALLATAVQGVFTLADTAVFITLPRQRLSFGPWQAQLAVLSVPRTLATMGFSLAGWQWGWAWGVGLATAVQLAAFVALIWGAMIEPFRLQLSELSLFTDRLPADAPPIRILHITDLHVERLTRRETAVLQQIAQTRPDIILITGDYVNLSYNQDPETHAQVRRLLRQMTAPHGVYAVLGSPPVDLREEIVPLFDGLPVTLLRQSWTKVDLGAGRQLVLVGMDCTHHLPTDRARLANLMTAVPNSAPQVFLYHSPELMPQAVEQGIDLYLCGHTHGGQVRLPFIGPILTSSQLGRQYVMGLYKDGRTHLYVSRGIGLEGLSAPRVRFLAPPEMALITLHGQSES